jgi:hypothetical protein
VGKRRSDKSGKTRRAERAASLLLPRLANEHAADERIQSFIEEWLVPRLVEEFIREHGFGKSSEQPSAAIVQQCEQSPVKCRSAASEPDKNPVQYPHNGEERTP